MYGLTGVESSTYLVDNSEFLGDIGLVASTLRSVEFSSESDRITSECIDYGIRIDLFSLVEDSCDLLNCDIGIDTDDVVLVY